MPINVFGNSSNNSELKIETSLFVQRPFLRINHKGSNKEEDIDLNVLFTIQNLKNPISIRETASKNYVDTLINDSSTKANTAHVDFQDRNLNNIRFVKVNSMPAVGDHLTAKHYVDIAISNKVDESSLLRLDHHEELKLDEQESIILNSTLT